MFGFRVRQPRKTSPTKDINWTDKQLKGKEKVQRRDH